MTTYTRQKLATKAASLLFMDGAGNSPEAEDVNKIDECIDGLVAELEVRIGFTVPDIEDINPAHFGPLAELLAMEAAPEFSKPRSQAVIDAAEERLRVLINRSSENYKLKTDPSLSGGYGSLSLARWARGG